MRRRRARGLTCRRKGCNNHMRRDRTFCDICWAMVPGRLRLAIRKARDAGDTGLLTRLWISASEAVKAAITRKTKLAYARNAALLGERDEEEFAE